MDTIINNDGQLIIIPVAIIPNAIINQAHCRAKSIAGYNARFGVNMTLETETVEVWYGSEKESYQNGGLPNNIIDALRGYDALSTTDEDYVFDSYGNRLDIMPGRLPVAMFDGLKEGDYTVLTKRGSLEHAPGVEIRLRLNQRNNRYSRFGEFHEVLAKLQSAQLRSECAASGRS